MADSDPRYLAVCVVTNDRKGTVHAITTDRDEARAMVIALVEKYDHPLAAHQTVGLVEPSEAGWVHSSQLEQVGWRSRINGELLRSRRSIDHDPVPVYRLRPGVAGSPKETQ